MSARRSRLAESSCGELPWQWSGDDLVLQIKVQPRASIDAITGIHDGYLRVKLSAAPVDGKANQSLTKLLSKAFGVPASQISIEKGENGKKKRVRVQSPRIFPEIIKLQ